MQFAGISLSGSNSNKTSIVILNGNPLFKPLNIKGLYEKIGSQGKLFSDERIIDIISAAGAISEVIVNCPLSLPPCITCVRPKCPGVVSCEDTSVAYMLALSEKIRAQGRAGRKPTNPQSHRLWDVFEKSKSSDANNKTMPTYNPSLAPLITRARTLEKRFQTCEPKIKMLETSIERSLQAICDYSGVDREIGEFYRSFESGKENRRTILSAMVHIGIIGRDQLLDKIALSVENFQALIGACVGAFKTVELCVKPPHDFSIEDGWVYVPKFSSNMLDDSSMDRIL